MKRREFVRLVGGAAAAWPFAAHAQQPAKMHRVAHVAAALPVSEMVGPNPINPGARALVQGLRALGYIEGKNLVLECRSAEGKYERLSEIMQELVSINVDVIVTGTNPTTKAAKAVTQSVPIVMMSPNPVEEGLIQSLARPGGNITGLMIDTGPEFSAKRVQLLKELLPKMSRLAFLHSEEMPFEFTQRLKSASQELGITLLLAEHTPTGYASAFALIERERPDALLVPSTAANFANRRLIAEFAAKSRLPAMYGRREFVEAGGLIAYGVGVADLFRGLAGYIDRILKGAKPADMPVEQPTKFQLTINLKSAKALGMEIPPLLLAQADEVIE
jgi:putative ABC transport system substrate-binding protein